MTKLSVIIPVYKTPRELLVRMFESVLKLPQDTEIVCVFDSPGDACGAVLEEYEAKDPRIRVLKNEKNIGETASRNRALEVIKGEYFTCVDADDVIEAGAYLEAIEKLSQYGLDACCVGMEGDGRNVGAEYDGECSFDRDDVMRQAGMSSCGIVFKSKLIQDNPSLRYPPGLMNNGDYVFATRFWWTAEKIAAIKKVGYRIVGHPDSSSRITYTARRVFSSATAARMVMEVLADKKLSIRMQDYYVRRLLWAQMSGMPNLVELVEKEPLDDYLANIKYATSVASKLFLSSINPLLGYALRKISENPQWLLQNYKLFMLMQRTGYLKKDMIKQLKRFVRNRVLFWR